MPSLPPATTRFAPSPTGFLHLGHAFSALFAEQAAAESGGTFLLRIEDIDPTRCKPEYTAAIFQDLGWLGLHWKEPVRLQSEHMPDYAAALAQLRGRGLLYPCFCTRREVATEALGAGYAPHLPTGDDTPILYAGTCRHLSPQEQSDKLAHYKVANWRLDMTKALAITGVLTWHDREQGTITARPQDFGDVVLARKDMPTSYHLSVTVDDHLQGINLVTRGQDLFRATDIHRVLQALLGYDPPTYHHHALQVDEHGQRFAKRNHAVTLRALREAGKTAEDIRRLLT